MLISHYVENVQTDLQTLARLGGDDLAAAGSRLGDAIEPALRGRLFEALNQLVAEANEEVSNLRLELRLSGDEVSLVRTQESTENVEAPSEMKARFALRLPEDLKALIDEHADRLGASTNAWIVRTLSKELGDSAPARSQQSGRTLRGSGRS
jgi:predicted HicB family RNase H-like nuclease